MPEWWTYSPSDFVMYSAGVYARMVARYHRDLWPLQLAAITAGVTGTILLWRRPAWYPRAMLLGLAAAWLWIAWAFHLQRFAVFNWPARWFAAAFALQAALLGAQAAQRVAITPRTRGTFVVALFAFAVFIEPFAGLLGGRELLQLELFGMTPDPTVVATIAMLLSLERVPRLLLVVPVAWSVVSALTWSVLGAPEWFVLAGAVAVALAGLLRPRPREDLAARQGT